MQVRGILRKAAPTIVGGLVVAMASPWLVALATALGWYDEPIATIEWIMSWLKPITTSTPFLVIVFSSLAFWLGVYLDKITARFDGRRDHAVMRLGQNCLAQARGIAGVIDDSGIRPPRFNRISAEIEAHLHTLKKAGLMVPDRATFPGDNSFYRVVYRYLDTVGHLLTSRHLQEAKARAAELSKTPPND